MGQIIPVVTYGDKKIAYMADLVMSVSHLPMPFIPAFDIQPLVALAEKEVFLQEEQHLIWNFRIMIKFLKKL